MRYRLSMLFEEDLKMQDELENNISMLDESEDMILCVLEERRRLKQGNSLFENQAEEPIGTDELTEDEELAVSVNMLDDNEIYDDEDY